MKSSASKTHAPEYDAWVSMRQRCKNPKNPLYDRYGGRGIYVCDMWESFDAFYADMGPRPSGKHSIDRIDNNGPYSPENCRWAVTSEQSRNTSKTRLIEANGKKMCLTDWAAEIGIHHQTLRNRLKRGWSIEAALNTPRVEVGRDALGRITSRRIS